ncbi:tetrapyrrole biosynthesis, uroporphyrinogen III synthase [Pisolithus microcarpus]|nr:tetrapyrrole biosynthesis, uroporphyrinogen III synthase [Pisolithus microcarpus]
MNVLLLRSPTLDVPDKYEAVFRTRGYSPISVPVLETTLVHLEQLAERIAEGPSVHHFTGVVITSKRSIEAWGQAVDSIVAQSRESAIVQEVSSGNEGRTSWGSIPFYVVGEVTAEAARELGKRLPHGLGPTDVRGRSEAGSAEQLARFILEDGDVSESKKMLYLTGDKNRDTMSRILNQGGVGLEELQVYETRGSSTFAHDLEDALRRAGLYGVTEASCWPNHTRIGLSLPICLPDDANKAWGWIVFFAPSAARHVYPTLRDHFFFRRLVDTGGVDELGHGRKEIAKVAAIGPTTASSLRDELGLRVDVVAPKPTTAELASAIVGFDSANHSVY